MTSDSRPPAPAANDEQSALTNLKALLLGEEQAQIATLQKETRDPDVQSGRVADSLPDSLRKSYDTNAEDLTHALRSPVSACIEDSVQRNPGFFADILYPVMGPAIRRSISQALKGLVQQLNQSLEHSLTLKGLKWRIEAARSGVPFAEVVLRHTLRYRVEEALLIQSSSGLLIQHVGVASAPEKDADAVSAMLTALRDFTQDTLRDPDNNSRLETIDVGDHTLWLMHGPHAYVACAIRGMPPVSLRDELNTVVEELHQRHGRLLENFDGDPGEATQVVPLLERCLRSEVEPSARKAFPWPILIVLTLLIALLGWWGYSLWNDKQAENRHTELLDTAAQQLRNAAGIIVTDLRHSNDRLLVSGLHDPLLPAPNDVLARAGLTINQFELDFRPFESSEPAAALLRAHQRIVPPDTVMLLLDDDSVLHARGVADDDWALRASLIAPNIAGINGFNGEALIDSDQRLRDRLQAALAPPPEITIQVANGAATLTGSAPMAWINSLPTTLPQFQGLVSLDSSRLRAAEIDQLAALIDLIDTTEVSYARGGTQLNTEQQKQIKTLATQLNTAKRNAFSLGHELRVVVVGHVDGTGSLEQNHFIASQRAASVVQLLRESGLTLPPLDQRITIQPANATHADAQQRKVTFRVTGVERTRLDR